MTKTQARYYVYSKTSSTKKPLRNAETREEARDYKRSQANPSRYGIFDRFWNRTTH